MKIVKCSKCGKYIHKDIKCLHCGNSDGFTDVESPSLHENATAEFARVEALLESKKFNDAITLSHTVLEWMPNFSAIFWLRLLARNKCTSALELISKGFSCEDDADFCNALSFSSGAEHNTYLDVQSMVKSIRNALKKEIMLHEHNCKVKTNILEIQEKMHGTMDTKRQTLFSLWSDLQETERKLYSIEMDCRLLVKEHQTVLEAALQKTDLLKTETLRLEECTIESLHAYQVKLGNFLQQSEQAKAAIESMRKQHPWIKAFSDLVSQRDAQIGSIKAEISSLKKYESSVQETLSKIDEIEKRHKRAFQATEKYCFYDAAALLGTASFNRVLREAGLGVDATINVPIQEWTSSPSVSDAAEEDDYWLQYLQVPEN